MIRKWENEVGKMGGIWRWDGKKEMRDKKGKLGRMSGKTGK